MVVQELRIQLHDVSCIYRMMWAAGSLASVSMITYPSMSALVSCNAEADQQGL